MTWVEKIRKNKNEKENGRNYTIHSMIKSVSIRANISDYPCYNPWGEIRGKLSTTPEIAQKMFGFKMKPGAKGIIFKKIGNKTFIINHFIPHNPRTKPQQRNRAVFGTLMRIGKEQINSITHPTWDPIAKGKPYSGFNLFIATNRQLIGMPPKWDQLTIAKGTIDPITNTTAYIYHNQNNIEIKINKQPKHEIGIGVLNTHTLKLYHITPQKYNNRFTITLPHKLKAPILYLYYKSDSNYSDLVSITPTIGEI